MMILDEKFTHSMLNKASEYCNRSFHSVIFFSLLDCGFKFSHNYNSNKQHKADKRITNLHDVSVKKVFYLCFHDKKYVCIK